MSKRKAATRQRWLPLLLASACPALVLAEQPMPTQNDFGGVGLMQTPTARMAPEGQFSFNANRTSPYSRYSVSFQPLPWLEGSIRYIAITNREYAVSTTGQSNKDKSVDVKARLWEESYWLPEFSVGMRDIGGTGLFSSEYLVANKRFYDLDFSLGVAWGYIGNRGDFANPLGQIRDSFKERERSSGIDNTESLFAGRPGVFGGVAWHTPIDGLQFQLEFEGNDYKSEPQDNNQDQDHPFNIGMRYRVSPVIEVSAGWQRGNTAMFGITLQTNLIRGSGPSKVLDPQPEDRQPLATGVSAREVDWAQVSERLRENAGIAVSEVRSQDDELIISGAQTRFRSDAKGLGRASRILDNTLGDRYEWYTLAYEPYGMQQAEISVRAERLRDWEDNRIDDDTLRRSVTHAAPSNRSGETLFTQPVQPFDWGVGLGYNQNLGGPDAFILYQFVARASASYSFNERSWVQAIVSANLLNNYDKFTYDGPSNLPRVRTDLRKYLTSSDTYIENMQYTQTHQFNRDWYGVGYAGLLEAMYGGFGGEVMYRPFGQNWAVGTDVNWVKQRGFKQDFSFRDYSVWTGHVTGYYQSNFHNILGKLSVGRYLARDIGATIDLSRRFDNGITVGAWATFTDVSSEEFGEGDFDKGVYFSFPFDAFFARSSKSHGNIVWQPLTRDGGARLGRRHQLYYMTEYRDTDRFNDNFRQIGD